MIFTRTAFDIVVLCSVIQSRFAHATVTVATAFGAVKRSRSLAYVLAARNRFAPTRRSFGRWLVVPSRVSSLRAHNRTSLSATSSARLLALDALLRMATPFLRSSALDAH